MSRGSRFALAGLQSGVSGALAMLVWLAIACSWMRRTAWWAPNLFATVFYGERSVRYGFHSYTVAGVALVLFTLGSLGLAFGLVWRDGRGGGRVVLWSVALAFAVYWILVRTWWKHLSAGASLYSPDRQIAFGCILYAIALSRYPRIRDRI